MAKEFGLTPEILADGATDLLEPPKEKPIQFANLTAEGDKTPRQVAQAASKQELKTPPSAGDLAGEEFDIDQRISEIEKKQKEQKSAAAKAQYAKVLSQYEPQLNAPAPKFEAPKETFTQLAGLGMMMMMIGSMAGGKTYGSAIGAMNGLAGMMKGYQEGRKEAYDKAKLTFEENLKSWKENKAQVKEAFQRALKLGATDLNKATTDVIAELTARGETTGAELVKKRGVAAAAQAFNVASQNADRELDAIQSTIARLNPAAPSIGASYAGAISKPDTGEKPKTPKEELEELRKRLTEIKRIKAVRKAEEDARKAQGKPEAPSSSRAGQQIAGITEEQTEEGAKAALASIDRYGITAQDQKIIPAEWNAIKQADNVARYVAEHPDAIGFVAQTIGKVGEPGLGILANLKQLFGADPENYETNASRLLTQKSSETDRLIDEEVKKDPSKEGIARSAKVASKMLFSLALADAVAVGRPTVFLERALSGFYSPNVRPDTLIDLIRERAVEANERLPKAFKNSTSRTPAELLTAKSADDYFEMKRPKAPAAASGLPTPKTEEEFNALKKGDRYIDPDDGKIYIK
jgi:hypothetical protein